MSHHRDHGDQHATDSAGVPWAGRRFAENPFENDDGSAPHELIRAVERYHAAAGGEADIVEAVRGARLLIPLVTHAGEMGIDEQGRRIDKTQELAIVTVTGPDGRTVMPVFTSVETLTAWNSTARPVPATAQRVALAAASEQTDVVVIDATSPTEYVLRRPALWAIAQSLPWMPCYADPEVHAAFRQAADTEPAVAELTFAAGDPTATLAGPELVVRVELVGGLSKTELDAVAARLQDAWATSEVIAQRVDSLRVQLVAAAPA